MGNVGTTTSTLTPQQATGLVTQDGTQPAGPASTTTTGAPGAGTVAAINTGISDDAWLAMGFQKDTGGRWVYTGGTGTAGAQTSGGATTAGVGTSSATGTQRSALSSAATLGTGSGSAPLSDVSPPPVTVTTNTTTGAQTFADNLGQALNDAFIKGHDAQGNPIYKNPNEVSSEDLLAAFLKLQIIDPNNSVETESKLLELAKEVRKQALDAEKAQIKEHEAKLAEAQKKSGHGSSKVLSIIVSVVIIVVAVVVAFFSFGTLGFLIAMAVIAAAAIIGYCKTGTVEGALRMASFAAAAVITVATAGSGSYLTGMLVGAGLGAAEAAPEVVAAYEDRAYLRAMADADSAGERAKKQELKAQQAQEDIQSRQEMIKMIMDAKGEAIDAVLKMMTNMNATNLKLATISVSR